jgi:hypothetical protein
MTLAEQLLRDGVPPSLLIDLLDPEGMKAALAAELLPSDVALAPAPLVEHPRAVGERTA